MVRTLNLDAWYLVANSESNSESHTPTKDSEYLTALYGTIQCFAVLHVRCL